MRGKMYLTPFKKGNTHFCDWKEWSYSENIHHKNIVSISYVRISIKKGRNMHKNGPEIVQKPRQKLVVTTCIFKLARGIFTPFSWFKYKIRFEIRSKLSTSHFKAKLGYNCNDEIQKK